MSDSTPEFKSQQRLEAQVTQMIFTVHQLRVLEWSLNITSTVIAFMEKNPDNVSDEMLETARENAIHLLAMKQAAHATITMEEQRHLEAALDGSTGNILFADEVLHAMGIDVDPG